MIGAVVAGALPAVARAESLPLFVYLVGALGVLALHERLRLEFDHRVAAVASLVLFAGTSLYWSMATTGSVADVAPFTIVAALLWLARRSVWPRLRPSAAWVLCAVVPPGLHLVDGSGSAAAATAGSSWLAALFSSSTGLLTLTPVAYVALVGTLVLFRTNAAAAAGALVTCGVWLIAHGVFPPPGPARPFGHGLTAALAVLAPGLAVVIDRARARPWLAAAPLLIGAIAWNYWLMVQYTVGLMPKDGPVSFASLVRQQADVHTRRPYYYPFAFPASVWFAWREGVPADRFELLAFEPRRASVDLIFDRAASRFLLDGWDAPGADTAAPSYWIRDRRATLVLPLEMPAGRDVSLLITARARLEEPAVNARMGLELNGREIGRFSVGAAQPAEISLHVPADIGPIWRAGYNQLTWVSYGVERADPLDTRPPGPLGRRVGDRAWPVALYRLRITSN